MKIWLLLSFVVVCQYFFYVSGEDSDEHGGNNRPSRFGKLARVKSGKSRQNGQASTSKWRGYGRSGAQPRNLPPGLRKETGQDEQIGGKQQETTSNNKLPEIPEIPPSAHVANIDKLDSIGSVGSFDQSNNAQSQPVRNNAQQESIGSSAQTGSSDTNRPADTPESTGSTGNNGQSEPNDKSGFVQTKFQGVEEPSGSNNGQQESRKEGSSGTSKLQDVSGIAGPPAPSENTGQSESNGKTGPSAPASNNGEQGNGNGQSIATGNDERPEPRARSRAHRYNNRASGYYYPYYYYGRLPKHGFLRGG